MIKKHNDQQASNKHCGNRTNQDRLDNRAFAAVSEKKSEGPHNAAGNQYDEPQRRGDDAFFAEYALVSCSLSIGTQIKSCLKGRLFVRACRTNLLNRHQQVNIPLILPKPFTTFHRRPLLIHHRSGVTTELRT